MRHEKRMIFPVISEPEKRLPFYLGGVGCYYPQEHVKRPEGYPYFQWIQCYRGEGELLAGGRTFRIKPQQGMLLFPNEMHEYYAVKAPWEVDWITFGGNQVERMIRAIGVKESGVFFVINADAVLAKIRRVLTTAQSDGQFKGVECSGLIYEILLDLYKYASQSSDDSIQHQYFKLQPVLNFLAKNFSKVVTLEDMAETIQVSPQHLCLLFKTILKVRPFEYLNQVRINKSKDILVGMPDMAVQEIARRVGFESASYFCAVFKKLEGISPGQFRRLHGIN